ncbi:hypothetical protein UFOVP1247_211 [uncultured Caudovirales phage]|jgi:hypothetical protein|uniref:Uncharacterized protein n=1 Tax=uncultured Caudovirales phage TaxID=2100421 RepID=A0A6J5R8D4_9CAUD|nr:hypothetical protein UFOVP970_251 [uncultured Caudovirales phage]CAB4193840.1 hypothetical protein UFOVP1247_211 [uncultured Caudovirales phage]
MLINKLLRAKKLFTISSGESIVDLISSTFNFGESSASAGITVVSEYETMRPDLLSEKIYSNQDEWCTILKFNGISNPFSLDAGEILLAPPFKSISKLIVPPKDVAEKGTEPAKKNESAVVKPKSVKDKQRLESLRTKTPEIVPPNVNLTGTKNVKVIDGQVILGGDMTQASTTNTNQSINRSRVQDQLKNNTTF